MNAGLELGHMPFIHGRNDWKAREGGRGGNGLQIGLVDGLAIVLSPQIG